MFNNVSNRKKLELDSYYSFKQMMCFPDMQSVYYCSIMEGLL